MSYKKFLILWFIVLSILAFLFFIVLKYLELLYEHNTYEEIVARQIKNNSIYGSALNENYFSYRLEMIKQTKPDIVILGTSRVGLFRQFYFNKTMITATNGANTLSEMEIFINRMLNIHKPKVVILNLDPWWLLKTFPNYSNATYQTLSGKDITEEKVLNILKYLLSNKIPLSTKFFNQNFIPNPYTNYDSLGIRAIQQSDGSLRDGSTAYVSIIYGVGKFQDIGFQNTLYRLKKQISPFNYGETLDQKRIQQFEKIQDILRKNGIEVIAFIAPIAPTIYDTIQKTYKKQFYYLNEINLYAKQYHIYNFFNPQSIDSSDCEFYDGFHGGDIAYAKILLKIAQTNNVIRDSINIKTLRQLVDERKDHTFALQHKEGMKEIDFLQIGCKK